MSVASEILAVITAEREPLSNKEIRERLDVEVTSERCAVALGELMRRGKIERVEFDGRRFPSYQLASGTTPDPAPKMAAPSKPAPEQIVDPVSNGAMADVRQVIATGRAETSRRVLMREAAMLLLDAAGTEPMTDRAARVIRELIEAAA